MGNAIRDEHREAFKAGKFSEIPQHALALLKEAAEAEKAAKKQEAKKPAQDGEK